MAAQGGYDSISWTPGDVQNKRYKLSNFISAIEYSPEREGVYRFRAIDKNGKEVINKRDTTTSEIEDYVGKEIATRIVNGEGVANGNFTVLEGVNLEVGGEGMKGFYDKILKGAVEKYVGKLDKSVKVGTSDINAGTDSRLTITKYPEDMTVAQVREIKRQADRVSTEEALIDLINAMVRNGHTLRQALDEGVKDYLNIAAIEALGGEANFLKFDKNETVWTIPLTDTIKEKVMEGQSLFQKAGDIKGQVIFKDNETIIKLFKSSDISTLIHELGHVFMKDMSYLYDAGKLNDKVKKDFETLKGFAGDFNTVEGQEKLARGFESYIREGKAPSTRLAKAFRTLRNWLIKIYKSIRALDVEINDDVREVFDRMLASEREIEDAKNFYRSKKHVEDLLNPPEKKRRRIQDIREDAENAALEKVISKTLKAYLKRIGGNDKIKEQAVIDVEKSDSFMLIEEIRKSGGVDATLAEDKNVKDLIIKNHGKDILVKEGQSDTIALIDKFNLPNEKAIIDLLAATPTKEKAVKDRTKEILLEKETTIREGIKDSAIPGDGNTHSEKSLELLLAESQLIEDAILKKFPNEERRLKKLEAQVYAAAAQEIIEDKTVAQASKFSTYANAERRFADQAYALLEKGDYLKAHEAKKKQILNHALVSASVKAREQRASLEKQIKTKTLKDKINRLENEYAKAVNELVSHYKLNESIKGKDGDLANVLENDKILEGVLPAWIVAKQRPDAFKSYKDLKYKEFIELIDAINDISEAGKGALLSIQDKDFQTVADFVEKAKESMSQLKDRQIVDEFDKKGAFLNKVKSFISDAVMAETLFERLDFYEFNKKGGFGVHRRLFNRGVKAETEYSGIKRKVMLELEPHFKTLRGFQKRIESEKGKAFSVPGLPLTAEMRREGRNSWTVEKLISFMLNTGNAGNLTALKNSYGYTDLQIAEVSKLFKEEELNAIQGVWDSIEKLYAPLNETHFKLYNRDMPRVEIAPISLDSQDGKTVTLKGGYYPLIFDHMINDRAESFKESKDLDKDLMANRSNAVLRKTKPEDGFTYARQTKTSLPPNLSLSVLFNHLDDTARYISHAVFLRDLNRITLNKEWKDMVRAKAGREAYASLRKWVQYQALPERRPPDTKGEKFLDWNRKLATIAILGLNVPVGVKQRLSIFNAIERIGWGAAIEGMREQGLKQTLFGLSNSTFWKDVIEASPYMRTRAGNIDREISDTVKNFSPHIKNFELLGKEFTWSDVQNFMFEWIQMNDRATVGMLWRGAYNKKLRENKNHENAVEYADSIIRTTQDSNLPIDLNNYQKSEGALRLFTSFMTSAFKYGNMQMEMIDAWRDGALDNKALFKRIMYDTMLPAWGNAIIGSLFLSGDLPDEWEIFSAPLDMAVSWLPFVRDISGAVRYNRKIGESTAFEGFNRVLKAGQSAWGAASGDKEFNKALYDFANVGAFYAGVPALKVYRDANRYYDIIMGEGVKK